MMRSERIHRTLAHGMSRYEICQLVSKGVRATHKSGSRFEDTINDTLDHLGTRELDRESADKAGKALEPAA